MTLVFSIFMIWFFFGFRDAWFCFETPGASLSCSAAGVTEAHSFDTRFSSSSSNISLQRLVAEATNALGLVMYSLVFLGFLRMVFGVSSFGLPLSSIHTSNIIAIRGAEFKSSGYLSGIFSAKFGSVNASRK